MKISEALKIVAQAAHKGGMSKAQFLDVAERAFPREVTAATSYNRSADRTHEIEQPEDLS